MYRIFLVEDDETIAKLVRRHLEKWDYDVHVVQKFDAVMSEFASFDPQLVLMDIGLPFYNRNCRGKRPVFYYNKGYRNRNQSRGSATRF